ncbi:class II aaRS and biotin synthetase [Trichodelitschia bisporula]|uniref:Class II aaRS and biotin synthetase n=1 Tax=Trichodelitschia bisporula TaxID=703511 RepID=A0A6G1I0V6_9PEZI|nr:class II aaRS and biotin synthetase [Trichodelitschia bisporula]
MCDLGWIHRRGLASSDELQRFRGMIKEGDYYSFAGGPIRSSTGELTLYCTSVPEALSPSLHDLPQTVINPDTLARFPQLDLAMNKQKRDLLRLRHHIERTMQEFLNTRTFIKVTTPILASDTGGAVARPFETRANEFSGSPLRLRIAQELALKKLIAADMGAVYEIGPVFRNEGIDATHNPEFTTCEFYQPYKTLDDLMSTTEELYSTLIDGASTLIASSLTSLTAPQRTFAASFPRLPFLPTLMSQLRTVAPGWKLPRDITSKSATEDLVALFTKLDMPLPPQPTAARLLDTLGARFIEPLCIGPTFVTHHPAVMSPLAKTFRDSETDHEVSARAEFFVAGTEVANMYEEENDPFTQARKFAVQRWGSDVVSGDADFEKCLEMLTPGQRYFVRVLEMGLPPTAGWGCGIDRLVMLLGGAKRIADVLPFGTLRSVVAMGAGGATDD